jgi:hypothetical protein
MMYREKWSRKAKNDVRRGRPDRYRSCRAEQQAVLVINLRKAASKARDRGFLVHDRLTCQKGWNLGLRSI